MPGPESAEREPQLPFCEQLPLLARSHAAAAIQRCNLQLSPLAYTALEDRLALDQFYDWEDTSRLTPGDIAGSDQFGVAGMGLPTKIWHERIDLNFGTPETTEAIDLPTRIIDLRLFCGATLMSYKLYVAPDMPPQMVDARHRTEEWDMRDIERVRARAGDNAIHILEQSEQALVLTALKNSTISDLDLFDCFNIIVEAGLETYPQFNKDEFQQFVALVPQLEQTRRD